MAQDSSLKAFRGAILHFLEDPALKENGNSFEYWQDGLLIVKDGLVQQVGSFETLKNSVNEKAIQTYKNGLILPGFIDTHIHYPQTEMIAAYGEQLLDWLNRYAFPAEMQFFDEQHATDIARFFIQQLLVNGTTTALVFGTVHRQSVDAFFRAAQRNNLRMICGKVLMDRLAPAELVDQGELGIQESQQLIQQWHNKDRLQYAITPRFAITSTSEQLSQAGILLKNNPGVYMHTHLSENQDELAMVRQLFPERENYLDVYHNAGLTGSRSVFAHSIHLEEKEWQCLEKTGSAIAHCPTSNLFLGSGLFSLSSAEQRNIPVGIGTDVGAGTSFSMLQTLNEAYKIQQLQNTKLSPLKAFYLATLGGAKSLSLDGKIGNFVVGKEADFVVLDLQATPLMKFRMSKAANIQEQLFLLQMLGDDRAVAATYVMGDRAYQKG